MTCALDCVAFKDLSAKSSPALYLVAKRSIASRDGELLLLYDEFVSNGLHKDRCCKVFFFVDKLLNDEI